MTTKITYQDKPWLANYESGVPTEIAYEQRTLPEFLERSAEKFPNHIALIFQGYKITYRQLNEMVNAFAACLRDFNIKKGDSVAILLPNIIPCVVAYYAIMKIGAITVMNNPLYSDRELLHQFNDSEAKVLITLDLLGNRMIDLKAKTNIRQIIYTSIGDYLPFPKNLIFKLIGKRKRLAADVKPAKDVYRWKTMLAKYTGSDCQSSCKSDDVAMYQYTGGTTGVSKGVILTHEILSRHVQQVGAWFPTFNEGKEIMLGALPFFHVFGLTTVMNLSIYRGWGNILIPKPQADELLEAISKYKPTLAPMVPTMYIGILDHPKLNKTDLTSIKGCFSGSAPLPVEVIKAFEEKTGAIIVEGYGLTETSPILHINPFNGKRKPGSTGVPISDTECRIVSLEDGKSDVPIGKTGEIVVRGPQIMAEYKNMPEETSEVLTKDGWFYTGDIAYMDEEGYFYIVDRKKDLIISGGFNVYPRDIEEVYYEHPKVQEACAIGIPHTHRGEAVKLFIVLKKGESATKEELLAYCQDKLAKYKWPLEIEFRDDLPKTNIGKILKKELRANKN